MVGGVEAFTLEDDPNRLVDLVQAFFVAFRTDCQRVIAKFLLAVELDAT